MKANLFKKGMYAFFGFSLFFGCTSNKENQIAQLKTEAQKKAGTYALIQTEVGSALFSLNMEKAAIPAQLFAGLAIGAFPNEAKEMNEPYYDGLEFYRVSKDRLAKSGSAANQDQGAVELYYPAEFNDLKHDKAGLLTMNLSEGAFFDGRFTITFSPLSYLDSRSVVFGEIVSSLKELKKLKSGSKLLKVEVFSMLSEGGELVPYQQKEDLYAQLIAKREKAAKDVEGQFSEFSKTFTRKALTALEKKQLKEGLFAVIDTTRGEIFLELYWKKTPVTVANFVGLAEGKIENSAKPLGVPYYDGLKFHRVIADFMIQGGCPYGNGTGGPGYSFKDEWLPELKHDGSGVLSMANSGPATNGSQFFITHVATPWLDGKHTVFGRVVEGQRVVDAVQQGDSIKKIRIIRLGAAAQGFMPNTASFKAMLAK